MSNLTIKSNFGLIGENLEIKKDISISIDDKGRINNILYGDIKDLHGLEIDKSRYLMIPGLINSHVHIGDSFAKEVGFNKPLIEVVEPPKGIKHRLLQTIDKGVLKIGINKATLEMLSCGTTLFIDFRESALEGIKILKDALDGISIRRLILGRTDQEDDIDAIINEADGFGFSSYDQISESIKKKLRILKNDYPHKIISCHDAELERNENLFENIINDGIIDIIVHGTHYIEQDLKKIKKSGISLVLCPRSNGYFGVGFPPISKVMELELPISLGTDNVMINNLNLFEEMRFLYRVYRVLDDNKNNPLLTSRELLKMTTINAAKNFNVEKDYGSVSLGKYADFFLVDLSEINLYTKYANTDQLYNLIVQRLTPSNIKKVYIGGKKVYGRL